MTAKKKIDYSRLPSYFAEDDGSHTNAMDQGFLSFLELHLGDLPECSPAYGIVQRILHNPDDDLRKLISRRQFAVLRTHVIDRFFVQGSCDYCGKELGWSDQAFIEELEMDHGEVVYIHTNCKDHAFGLDDHS